LGSASDIGMAEFQQELSMTKSLTMKPKDDLSAPIPDAYAVYVAGASMEPRYFPEEIVYVHPRLPVWAGDFVVAQIATGVDGDPPEAYVKQLVSMDGKKLRLKQFNPKKTFSFPANKVVSVHKIIMGGIG
jgi:phage repressor protein C with HTH and peptisase S24 domain